MFIRFAGCNLRCSFCDTEFESYREMSNEEILAEVEALRPQTSDLRPLLVLTGGEPTLQVDETFVDFLHQHGYEVAMESNGTRPAPKNLDWLTVSPKESGQWKVDGGKRLPDEIKVVFDEHTAENLSSLHTLHPSQLLYLQPCDTGDAVRNKVITQACVEYIKAHPQWRLSLQIHKLIDIE